MEGSAFDYEMKEESNIYMVVSLDGGKKKKKKVKKAKKHHKKKKVKFAVLNYFKVEDGKIVRLRQKSPAGTFMAEHNDRFYCGRSHITYKKKEVTEKKAPAKKEEVVADAKPAKAEGGKGKKK